MSPYTAWRVLPGPFHRASLAGSVAPGSTLQASVSPPESIGRYSLPQRCERLRTSTPLGSTVTSSSANQIDRIRWPCTGQYGPVRAGAGRRRAMRFGSGAGRLHEQRVAQDVGLVAPHHAHGDLGRGRCFDRAAQAPEGGQVVFDGRAQVFDPSSVEQPAQADHAVAPEGVDFGVGDGAKWVGGHEAGSACGVGRKPRAARGARLSCAKTTRWRHPPARTSMRTAARSPGLSGAPARTTVTVFHPPRPQPPWRASTGAMAMQVWPVPSQAEARTEARAMRPRAAQASTSRSTAGASTARACSATTRTSRRPASQPGATNTAFPAP